MRRALRIFFMVSVLIFKLQIVHGHNIPVLDAHLLQPVK